MALLWFQADSRECRRMKFDPRIILLRLVNFNEFRWILHTHKTYVPKFWKISEPEKIHSYSCKLELKKHWQYVFTCRNQFWQSWKRADLVWVSLAFYYHCLGTCICWPNASNWSACTGLQFRRCSSDSTRHHTRWNSARAEDSCHVGQVGAVHHHHHRCIWWRTNRVKMRSKKHTV